MGNPWRITGTRFLVNQNKLLNFFVKRHYTPISMNSILAVSERRSALIESHAPALTLHSLSTPCDVDLGQYFSVQSACNRGQVS